MQEISLIWDLRQETNLPLVESGVPAKAEVANRRQATATHLPCKRLKVSSPVLLVASTFLLRGVEKLVLLLLPWQ